ncbi:hypothetical protein [Leifsonia kafniensis]
MTALSKQARAIAQYQDLSNLRTNKNAMIPLDAASDLTFRT